MMWNNGKRDGDMIMELLDRVLHTVEWLGLFPFT